MSTSTQPATYSELYTDLQNRVRADTSVSATVAQAKRYINIGLLDMHIGTPERFPWAEREAILLTHSKDSYTGDPDGGINVTNGSATVTFTLNGSASLGITGSNSFAQPYGRKYGNIRVSGDSEIYRLASDPVDLLSQEVGSLDTKYLGDSSSAETAFDYWEDEYPLASDFLRPVDATRFTNSPTPIKLIGRNQFRDLYPRNDRFGSPTVATLIDRPKSSDTTPVRRIRFSPVPATTMRIHYSYITNLLATSSAGTGQTQLVEDTDEPIVPIRYRMAIVYHGLYSWYRDRGDDPVRAQLAKAQYDELVGRIRADTEVGQSRPRFGPAKASYMRKAIRPWRGSGGRGRFDMGGFDYGDR